MILLPYYIEEPWHTKALSTSPWVALWVAWPVLWTARMGQPQLYCASSSTAGQTEFLPWVEYLAMQWGQFFLLQNL